MQGNLLKTTAIFIKKVQKKKQLQPGEGLREVTQEAVPWAGF